MRDFFATRDGKIVNHAEFIKAWNDGDDASEVGKIFGVTGPTASIIASKLRKDGKDMKFYKKGRKALKLEDIKLG